MVIKVAEENEQMEVQPPANKVPGAKNPILTILVILNTIILGAVAFFQFKSHEKLANTPSLREEVIKIMNEDEATAAENSGQAKVEKGKVFPLDGFTANLAQGDGPRRFLRLKTVLKFSTEAEEEEYQARQPQIRDTIITILNGKRPEDLLTVQGKNFLKEEIKAGINAFMVKGHVLDVYYTSFQIN